jgi:hypothetical protein
MYEFCFTLKNRRVGLTGWLGVDVGRGLGVGGGGGCYRCGSSSK